MVVAVTLTILLQPCWFILMPLSASAAEKIEKTVPVPQKQAVPQKVEKKTQPPVTTNFQPTEKIKADTVVAFPADI